MPSYDAFVSYSHAADRFRALALQRTLHRLARPPFRLKALNVFRDESSLAANPRLWSSIERALENSRHFVLLACPQAAQSVWCRRELAWWLAHRSVDQLLLVVTGGDYQFDEERGDFDWTRTTALPDTLRGRFDAEPLVCDLRWLTAPPATRESESRFRAAVLPLAAALHGTEPQALDSEDLRQYRRNQWFWRGAGVALSVLTLSSLGAAWVAVRNGERAEHEAAVAGARRLAAEAEAARLGPVSGGTRAVLLAVEAARRLQNLGADSAELDATLRRSLNLLPERPAALAQAKAAAIWVADDGLHAVSANLDGRIARWDLSRRQAVDEFGTDVKASDVAIAPDGSHVAFAVDRSVQVWSVASRQRLFEVTHGRSVSTLAFSADGARLGSGDLGGQVMVHRLPGGERSAVLQLDAALESIAFSADGRYLAAGIGSVAARLIGRRPLVEVAEVWDLGTGRRRVRLPHPHVVTAVAFGPDGQHLATGTQSGSARVWDWASSSLLAEAMHPDGVNHLRFTPDGQTVVSASRPYLVSSRDQTVQIWSARDGREQGRVIHGGAVQAIAVDTSGGRVASASADGSVRWFGLDGVESARLVADGGATALAFSRDGTTLMAGTRDQILLVPTRGGFRPSAVPIGSTAAHIDVAASGDRLVAEVAQGQTPSLAVRSRRDGAEAYRLTDAAGIVLAAFSPDGQWLATTGHLGHLALRRAADGQVVHVMTQGSELHTLAFTPDGRDLVTAGSDGVIKVWQVDTGVERLQLKAVGAPHAMAAAGDHIVAISDDGKLQCWDRLGGALLARVDLPATNASLALRADGRRVSVNAGGPLVVELSLPEAQTTAQRTHESNVSAMRYLPDGRLVTGTWDGRLRIWQRDGARVDAEAQHDDGIQDLAHDAEGRFLVTGSGDRTARVWRVAGLQEVARMPHPLAVAAVAFDPDGHRVWTASGATLDPAHALRAWRWRLEDLVEEACRRLPRNLRLDEWRRHLPDEPYRSTCPGLPAHVTVLADQLAQAQTAAQAGEAGQARRRYLTLSHAATETDSAEIANQICWLGSLDGEARAVLPVCDRATALAPGELQALDSRGLARALAGNQAGAVVDFETVVAGAARAGWSAEAVAKRRRWLETLGAGGNPFDAETIAALKRGE